jgi:hypothetical protein
MSVKKIGWLPVPNAMVEALLGRGIPEKDAQNVTEQDE